MAFLSTINSPVLFRLIAAQTGGSVPVADAVMLQTLKPAATPTSGIAMTLAPPAAAAQVTSLPQAPSVQPQGGFQKSGLAGAGAGSSKQKGETKRGSEAAEATGAAALSAAQVRRT